MRSNLGDILSEEENDRTEIRAYLLSLGGFIFTALIALILLEPKLQNDIQFSIYYIFLSFLLNYFALSLQGYKSKRWHDILSDALLETSSLCLILTVVSLLFVTKLNQFFIYAMTIIALVIWLLDFIIRLNIQIDYLNTKEGMQ